MSENENLNTPPVATENEGGQEENKGGINTLEEALAELKRVRQEAASRRITNRELEEKAKRWEEYEESQKSELQKLQDALAEREQKLTSYELKEKKLDLIKEFGLENDDLALLTGSDEASNRQIAETLKARYEKLGASQQSNRPADLLAGNRGTPVGSTNDTNTFDDMLRRMAQGR